MNNVQKDINNKYQVYQTKQNQQIENMIIYVINNYLSFNNFIEIYNFAMQCYLFNNESRVKQLLLTLKKANFVDLSNKQNIQLSQYMDIIDTILSLNTSR